MRFNLNSQNPAQSIEDLDAGLDKLTLGENFKGFFWNGTIVAGDEVRIVNKFRDGKIPTGFLVTMVDEANTIGKGTNQWTANTLYLKNYGANDLNVTVFFLT